MFSCWVWDGKQGIGTDTYSYAEMDKSEKNKISHRGKALDKLKAWLAECVDA